LESTVFDDVMAFCPALEVAVVGVLPPAVGAFTLVVGDTAVAVDDVKLPVAVGGSFCCDEVETATTDDVITCGCDVTD